METDPRDQEASFTEPLRILFQDENLVAIDKPAGMVVHSTKELTTPEWVVMKRLRDQIGRKVYPAHRLDRPTCGVLLFALDEQTLALLHDAFTRREMRKTYLAVVDGVPPERWESLEPIEDSAGEKETHAHTAFERLAMREGISLVKALPTTGRFHQIRRHLAGAGFPIVGDYRYGDIARNDELREMLGTGSRMLLQAKSLEFTHPYSVEALRLEAPEERVFHEWFAG
ncbi:MAG: pseudouridine synthase [Luteolibacter sp.]